MKFVLLILIFLTSLSCQKVEAKCKKNPIKIAVLDTGFGYENKGHDAHLCQYGHKDFSIDRQFTKDYGTFDMVPKDNHGHGTNITGIIESYARAANVNYCIVVVKYYSVQQSGNENLVATVRALNYLSNIGVDYINYSGGGPIPDTMEKNAIKKFLNQGGHLIAAAGNDNQNLDDPKNTYFPAMYDKRIIVVGNTCKSGVKCKSSNYGNVVNRWEIGENVSAYGVTMTGTSQATAVATGKIVAQSDNTCDIGL